jgi:hypothetical protein
VKIEDFKQLSLFQQEVIFLLQKILKTVSIDESI